MLFGRGGADMKGGLAAMILAAQAVRESGAALRGRLGLVFVPDEETGGAGGSAALARAGLLGEDGIGMLSPEPTGGIAWNACRGAISLRVTVHGTSAHVGLSHSGVNAFTHMLDVASALRGLATEVGERHTAYAIEPAAARGSILLLGGQVESGANFNVVPGRCSFTVDRRINPEEDLAEERDRLLDLLERLRGEGHEDRGRDPPGGAGGRCLGRDRPGPGACVRPSRPSRAPTCGSRCAPACSRSASTRASGSRHTCYGPGRLEVSRGPDEHVAVDALSGTPRCTRSRAGLFGAV